MADFSALAVKIGKPTFKLVRMGWDGLVRARMEPIYRHSHLAYLRRHVPGRHWRPLGNAVEYSLSTVNDFTAESGGEALLLVRARPEVGKVRRAVVRVSTVTSGRTRQLPPTRFDNVGTAGVEAPLVGMPIERLSATETDFVFAYDDVVVELLELEVGASHRVFGEPPSDRFHPTYTDYLNGEFERRWETSWNLDELAFGRDQFRGMLRSKFLAWHEDLSWIWPRTVGGVLRRVAASGITHPKVLDFTFRGLLASGLLGLDPETGFTWRWQVIPRSGEDVAG